MQPLTHLSLTVEKDLAGILCLLSGGGFKLRVRLGGSVRELLCGQLGVESDYLDDRIGTIFLNNKVVDDPDTAIVTADSTLALSAAMPGIAGAVLRKGSHYAPMRSQLSHNSRSVCPPADHEGDLIVKLFNMVQQELGPRLLSRGVEISGHALSELLHRRLDAFRTGLLAAELDGEPVATELILETDWNGRRALLVVRC